MFNLKIYAKRCFGKLPLVSSVCASPASACPKHGSKTPALAGAAFKLKTLAKRCVRKIFFGSSVCASPVPAWRPVRARPKHGLKTPAPVGAAREAFMLYLESGLKVQMVLRDGVVTVGHSSAADYSILDPHVGEKHAEFIKTQNQYFIRNYNSSEGTYLNGRKLSDFEIAELRPWDSVRLATVEMRFFPPRNASVANAKEAEKP